MAKAKFVFFKDAGGEYRWNLKAGNGEKIADSAEGYKGFKDCVNGAKLVGKFAKTAAMEDTTGEMKPAKKAKASKKKAKAKAKPKKK